MSLTSSTRWAIPRARRNCSQRGLSLVEVLVTTVIFSIGLIGISGLNIFAKRSSFEAVQRSTAAQMAYAMLEEMHLNKTSLADYLLPATIGGGALGARPSPDCAAPGAVCTGAQLAAHSKWNWEQMLDTGMENTNGTATGGLITALACFDGPPGGSRGVYTITIVWRGVTALTDPGENSCGSGTGLYGDGDNLRRMVVVQSYIDPALL